MRIIFCYGTLHFILNKYMIYSKPLFGSSKWNEMKMNEENNLEYYSLSLFGSFNRGNGKSIPLFGSLSGRE